MVAGNVQSEIRNDPEGGEWLTRQEFMDRTGVIERTLTNRIKSNYYRHKLDENGNRKIFYSYAAHEEKRPERFQNATGISPEGLAGNASGSNVVDPEVSFLPDRKITIVDPAFSRSEVCLDCERLKGRIDLLTEQLKAVEVANAKLEGQMDGKDALLAERDRVIESLRETISAKDQAVSATQAAFLQLEKNTLPALETSTSGTSGNGNPEGRKNIFHRLRDALK